MLPAKVEQKRTHAALEMWSGLPAPQEEAESQEQPEAVRDSLVGRLERGAGTVDLPELEIAGKTLDNKRASKEEAEG